MDFEPWLRDQLARRQAAPPLDGSTVRSPSRPRRVAGGLRAGFAGAGIALAVAGVISGKALPALQLTTQPNRPQEIPISTWAGIPSQPPGSAELAATAVATPSGSSPARLSTPSNLNAARRGGPGSAAPSGRPVPSDSGRSQPGSALTPSPTTPRPSMPDDGGGQASPEPSPSATAEDHGGRGGSPTPGVESAGRRGPQPSPSPTRD